VEASTSPEYFMNVMKLTLTEIYNLFNGTSPLDDDELWKAKMQIRGQHLISSESSNTQMSRLATQELYFANHITSEQILNSIDDVNSETIGKVLENLRPTPTNTAISVVGPNAPNYFDRTALDSMWVGFN